jgi:lipoprotein-releasing system permease protein
MFASELGGGFEAYVPSDVSPGILIGAELAESLNASVGSEIQVISPDGDVGPTGLRPKVKTVRVAGLFRTGMFEYDQKLAYLARDEAQRFFNLGADLNRIEVRLTHADHAPAVQAKVDRLLAAGQHDAQALGWRERNRSLFAALALERVAMFAYLVIMVGVGAVLICSALFMIIIEKAREIAILKALGATNRQVIGAFLAIGLVIGLVGAATGVATGLLTCAAADAGGLKPPREFYIEKIPIETDLAQTGVIVLVTLSICLVAAALPAWQASRLKPVEGIRHG